MTLDESTRRNLELTETMRGGDAKGSLLGVLDDTLTPMGSRLLRRWLNQPLLDVAAINRRLDAVQLLRRRHRAAAGSARACCARSATWSAGPTACVQGVALPRDLVGMREVLRLDAWRCTDLLGQPKPATADPSPTLPTLPLCADVLALLEAAIADEPPATLATPGIIRPGFGAELDGLVEKSRHAKDWIANLEQVERERLDIKSLKVGYNKVFGYYIEVTNTPRGQGARPTTSASRRSPTPSATSRRS